MSENMKKIYQAYADAIAPDPDMEARLKRQLYAEMQGERPRKRNYGRRQFSRWLVVACMLFLVSGGCLTYAITRATGQTGRERWIVEESTNENRLLGQKNVAITDMNRYSEEERPWILQQMLRFDSVIVLCDVTDANGAGEQTRMSETELQALCASLQTAVICDGATAADMSTKSAVRYQVLIQYKPFIKFTVYDGTYLQIEDETTIYKIKN